MDGSAWDHHHQAREIAEDHTLPLRQIRTQKRPKHILIQRNRTIYQFLPINSAVTGEAVKAKIKEVQTRRVFDIIGVYEDNAIREVGKLSKAQNSLNHISLAVNNNDASLPRDQLVNIPHNEALQQLRFSMP